MRERVLVNGLMNRLRAQPGEIDVARRKEASAKLARDAAREDYDLAVVNALMAANGTLDGRNAEERKLKSDAYLAEQASVKVAKERLAKSEAELLNAQLERQKEEDVFAALRTEARLVAAYLECLAGEARNGGGGN